MIEWLESIDRDIVLFINGLHQPFLDELMWFISGKIVWIPFYLFLIYLFYRKSSLRAVGIFVLVAIAAVGLADFISSQIIKDTVMRYRPSHNALLTHKLHFYTMATGEHYKGGEFGFVSSHAANFFAICTFTFLCLKEWYPRSWWLLGVAVLVSFSRLYLGVHYVTDLFFGGLLGATIAWLLYRFVFLNLKSKV